ncbi:MAG: hypothetical protein ACR2RL_13785 [Gammaproteobacteria bacterium]
MGVTMGVVLLVVFASLTLAYGRPLVYAIVYAIVFAALGLGIGTSRIDVLSPTAIALAFATGHFWLIDRYSERLFLSVAILVLGTLVWIGWPFVMPTVASAVGFESSIPEEFKIF